MRDKVVNFLMSNIKKENKYDNVKLAEIKYGLLCLYSLITKTTIIFILSLTFNITKEFLIFLFFYNILRSLGAGSHAKTNCQCWIFSTLFFLGFPYLFKIIHINLITKLIIWNVCFIDLLIFSPADTDKKPMINKKRRLKLKILILLVSILYLILLYIFNNISNFIIASMILQAFLVNPISYILFGQKIRFRLNYINLSKNRMEESNV